MTVTPAFNRRVRLIRVRWRLVNQPLRLTVQTAVATAAGITIFVVLRASHAIDATAASLIVAAVFGSATVLQQRQTQRQQYTIDLISAFQTAEKLAAADTWMASRIANNVAITADVSKSDEPFVVALLDYYEFLAILSVQGLVDVSVVLELRGGTMTRCFHLCRRYIQDRRDHVGPGLYSGLEIFTEAVRLPAVNHPQDAAAASSEASLTRIPGADECRDPSNTLGLNRSGRATHRDDPGLPGRRSTTTSRP